MKKTISNETLCVKKNLGSRLWKNRWLFLLFLPTLLTYIFFKYVPMWGVTIAFKDYKPLFGYWKSEWVGLQHFRTFFSLPDSTRVIKNTLILGLESLIFTFPLPILLALLLNEIRNERFKKTVQTVSYLPHFLSVVVVCGMVTILLDPLRGGINQIISALGGKTINFLSESKWFRPVYIITGVWQGLGWNTIIYLAAISGVDVNMYEAARLDGANRIQQMFSITLPSIAPTMVTMLILSVGRIMDSSVEKALLLQKPITYDVSDLISTYVYRFGMLNNKYGYSTAVGLVTAVVNLVLLLTANTIAKKISENSLF